MEQRRKDTAFRQRVARTDGAYILVDMSNIWIEGKKAAAGYAGENPLFRVDIDRTIELMLEKADEARMAFGCLLGSLPPHCSKVLERWRQTLFVDIYRKSAFSNSEKLVDAEIVNCLSSDLNIRETLGVDPANRVYCLASGDRDFLRIVEDLLSGGNRVLLFSWRRGTSSQYSALQQRFPDLLEEYFLDDFIRRIGFVENEYKKDEFPPDRTIFIDYPRNQNEYKRFFADMDTLFKKLQDRQLYFQKRSISFDQTTNVMALVSYLPIRIDRLTQVICECRSTFGSCSVLSFPEYQQRLPHCNRLKACSNVYSDLEDEGLCAEEEEDNELDRFAVAGGGPAAATAEAGRAKPAPAVSYASIVAGCACIPASEVTAAAALAAGPATDSDISSVTSAGDASSEATEDTFVSYRRRKVNRDTAVRRCEFLEFCDNPTCKFGHSDREKELFCLSGGHSPYKLRKYRECNAAKCNLCRSQPRECPFRHPDEPEFCRVCLSAPCVNGPSKCPLENASSRALIDAAKRNELIRLGYLRR